MKFFKNLSLYVAATFLLLHSFIPHFHQNDENQDSHVLLTEGHKPNNFYHLIQEALSITDPGQHHLEDYSTSEDISIDYYPLLVESLRLELISSDLSHPLPIFSFSEISTEHSISKRGPPTS